MNGQSEEIKEKRREWKKASDSETIKQAENTTETNDDDRVKSTD